MILYTDSQLLKVLKESESIDFGIVEVGTKKQVVLYMYNETKALLRNINVSISDKRVEAISYPKELQSRDKGILVLEWTPSISIKEPLKCSISIEGEEIYG